MKKSILILLGLTLFQFILNAQTVRTPENFNKLNIASAFTVELQQAETNKIEISGVDDEYLGSIATEVKNNTLYIYAKKKIIAKSTMNIVVSYVVLDELTVSGAATVKNNEKLLFNNFVLNVSGATDVDLNADYIELTAIVSGASDVNLKGNTSSFNLKSSGASDVKAGNLSSKDVELEISGASTVTVYANTSINGVISGASNLKINGNPKNGTIKSSGVSSVSPSKYAQNSKTFNNKNYDDNVTIKVTDSLGVFVEDEDVDVRAGNKRVKVINDTTRIKWGGTQLIVINDSFDISHTPKIRRNHWAGLDLGINGFATSFTNYDLSNNPDLITTDPKEVTQFMELRLRKSWSFSFNFYEKFIPIKEHHFGLVTGLGFEWNNYELRHNVRLNANGGSYVYDNVNEFNNDYTWGEIDTVRNYSKNRFKTIFINAPLMLEYNSGKTSKNSFHFAAGAIFGFNLQTKMKYKYKEPDGGTKKEKDKQDFNTNVFRVSLTARFGYGWFNMFATYSLTQLFENNKGPEIYPYSIGVTLLTF